MARRLVAIAIVILLGMLGCRRDDIPTVNLSDLEVSYPGSASAASSAMDARAPLRVAVAPVISPREGLSYYGPLLQYLSDRIGRQVQVIQRHTYAEINALMKSGAVDMAFVCTYSYVQGKQEFGMELLAAPEVNGRAEYRAYLVVPADSKVERFADLKGKTFAFTDPMSTSGRLVPLYWLHQMGQTPESFFRSYIFTYSHDNSVRAVAAKVVDAATVDSLVFETMVSQSPHFGKELKVVARSEAFGSPPVVVRPGLDPALKKRLREILLGLDKDARGRQILKTLRVDRFVLVDDRAYAGVREMLSKVGR